MCDKCKWPAWAAGIGKMLESGRVEQYKAWLTQARRWIEANKHVTKDIAYLAARIEHGAGLDRIVTPGMEKVTDAVVAATKAIKDPATQFGKPPKKKSGL